MNAVKNDTQAREKDARANSDVSGLRRKDRKIRYIAVDEIDPAGFLGRAQLCKACVSDEAHRSCH